MFLWPRRISPSLAISWPATMRSVVDLPQPEGPSKQQYDPAGTFRLIESTARTSPYLLVTFRSSMPGLRAIFGSLSVVASASCKNWPTPEQRQCRGFLVNRAYAANTMPMGLAQQIPAFRRNLGGSSHRACPDCAYDLSNRSPHDQNMTCAGTSSRFAFKSCADVAVACRISQMVRFRWYGHADPRTKMRTKRPSWVTRSHEQDVR